MPIYLADRAIRQAEYEKKLSKIWAKKDVDLILSGKPPRRGSVPLHQNL